MPLAGQTRKAIATRSAASVPTGGLTDALLVIDLGQFDSAWHAEARTDMGDLEFYDEVAAIDLDRYNNGDYDSGTDSGHAWVRCDLSDTVDNEIGAYVGEGSLIADDSTVFSSAGWDKVWLMDDASGNFDDASGSDDAVPNATPTYGTTAPIGSGITFSANYATFTTPGNLTTMTVSLWVKPTALTNRALIEFAGDNGRRLGFFLQTSNLLVGLFDNGTAGRRYDVSSAIGTGKYYKIDISVNSGVLSGVYIDGSLASGSESALVASTANVAYIGRFTGGSFPYSGDMDTVMISTTQSKNGDYLGESYANQNAPDTYWSYAASEATSTTFERSLTLSFNGAVSSVSNKNFARSLSLGISAGDAPYAKNLPESLTIPVSLGISVTKFSQPPTPQSRTLTVPFESRTLFVPSESRTVSVPYENRTLTVPYENRTYKI